MSVMKTFLKSVARAFLILLFVFFAISISVLFPSAAKAEQMSYNSRSQVCYLMVKSSGHYPWVNIGQFGSHLACEHAARNMMRMPKEKYVCVPLNL